VVENRPGGGGSLGMGMVARGRPDGSVFLVSSASNHVFHPLVSGDLGYDARESLPAVSMLVDVPNVIAANPAVGVNTIQELIAKVRATRGGFSFASSGVGTSNHLAGELFRLRTGLELTHVPYRGGGPALNEGRLVTSTVIRMCPCPSCRAGACVPWRIPGADASRPSQTCPPLVIPLRAMRRMSGTASWPPPAHQRPSSKN